ncbi:MAG: hypothetical protein F4Y45_04370 [Acidobacteria bacterium]|nr:hypothetical protein [Acidobacteriota bacterium]MYJ06002.1 hypothetical protein [Acidobacteriota bacterium]
MQFLARLERLLFRQLEAWLVLLLLTIVLVGALLFAAVVKHHTEGRRRTGVIGEVAFYVAGLPEETLRVFSGLRAGSRFATAESRFNTGGLTVHAAPPAGDDGYLLVARHDPERNRGVLELMDLERQETIHAWRPDLDRVAERMRADRGRVLDRQQGMTPYVWPDGSLAFRGLDAFLVMLDRCSNVEWAIGTPRIHHSVEVDADGYLWAPNRPEPPVLPGAVGSMLDEALTKVSRSGTIVSSIPLGDLLIRNGYGSLIYVMDQYPIDPMHVNDIQPVLKDGPYWRRGDLFISLRTNSVVLLYRPSTDRIVWLQSGPWLHQHDVNVLNDHEISILSNNTARLGDGQWHVLGANEVYIYDFATGESRSPWRDALLQHDVRSETQGRATVIDEDDVFVEESDHGRALRVSTDGTLRWSYVNRGPNGRTYQLFWSRYLSAEEGDPIAQAVTAHPCP